MGRSERRGPLDFVLRLLAVFAMLITIAFLGMLLLVMVDVARGLDYLGNVLGSEANAIARVRTDLERGGDRLQSTAQGIADLADPAHPPRQAIAQDTEFDELHIVHIGDGVGRTNEYQLSLAEIKKRDGAGTEYAAVHRQLLIPHETRLLGRVIHVDRDEADYYLYKGESFQLAGTSYKVNWLSADQQTAAIVRYRNPADAAGTPKFQLP